MSHLEEESPSWPGSNLEVPLEELKDIPASFLVEEASEFIGLFVDTRWTARRRRKTVTSFAGSGVPVKTQHRQSLVPRSRR